MAGLLLVCMAAFLWGTVGVARASMSEGPAAAPVMVGLVRTLLGAGCLLTTAWILRLPHPGWRRLPIRPILVFGVAGATFQICLFSAFSVVGVTVTVAVTVCAPVLIVAATDAISQRKVPGWDLMIALAVASVGVLLVLPGQDPGKPSLTSGYFGGALLAGASLAFAALALAARSMTRHCEPVRAAGLGLVVSFFVLAAIAAQGAGPVELASVLSAPGRDLWILVYVGVIATGGAYLAFVLGMHWCSSPSVGLTATMIEPGVAALLAALMLQERLTPSEAVGCGLMMMAVLLMSCSEQGRATDSRRGAMEPLHKDRRSSARSRPQAPKREEYPSQPRTVEGPTD